MLEAPYSRRLDEAHVDHEIGAILALVDWAVGHTNSCSSCRRRSADPSPKTSLGWQLSTIHAVLDPPRSPPLPRNRPFGILFDQRPRIMTRHPSLSLVLSLIVLLPATSIAGQEDPQPSRTANWKLAEKWLPNRVAERVMGLEVVPHWLPDRDAFWYRFERRDGIHYWLVDAAKGKKEPLFARDAVAAELTRLTKEPVDALSLDFTDIELVSGTQGLRFTRGDEHYEYDRSTQQLTRIEAAKAEPGPPDWANASPDGAWYVFVRGHDLYMKSAAAPDDQETRLSTDGAPNFTWAGGQAPSEDAPHERHAVAVTWSSDSRRFAITRNDARGVEDLWLVDPLSSPRPTLRTYKCSMPGEDVAQEELWIGNVEAKTMVQVDTARWPDQMLYDLFHQCIWWNENASALYFTRRSRDYMSVDLCSADPATGQAKPLIEERIQGQAYTKPLVQLEKREELLWWSMRDGWGHLYLYDREGTLLRQITRGAFNVDSVVAVDEEAGVLYVIANGREKGRNVYYRHLYAVELDGGEPRLLTPEDAEHACSIAPSKRFFVDAFGRVDMGTTSVLRDHTGKLIADLETADISHLEQAGWVPPEPFVAKSADGVTDQWGVLYRPFDFDPNKKYPIVTRVYPGRQSEFIPRAFKPVTAELVLAQLGCIVVQFGNRGGTYERGLAYREHAREEFVAYGLADKKAVLEQLGDRYAWIDLDRVGIYGGSSGGFMTISAMLVHPEFFNVGVAMTAPNDPSIYHHLWAERYYGVEQVIAENGTSHWESKPQSNIDLADQLQGRLLMVNGGADANVHPAHMHRMAKAFIEAGKRFDMFVIPGVGHGLGDWRVTYGLLWDYFATHLIGDPREGPDRFPK